MVAETAARRVVAEVPACAGHGKASGRQAAAEGVADRERQPEREDSAPDGLRVQALTGLGTEDHQTQRVTDAETNRLGEPLAAEALSTVGEGLQALPLGSTHIARVLPEVHSGHCPRGAIAGRCT